MANTKSASKRARQTTVRSLRNRSVLTRLRKMQKGVSGADSKPEAKAVQAMISAIDKAAKRGIIHKNAAKRWDHGVMADAELDELFAAKPEEFTALRTKLAAAAK